MSKKERLEEEEEGAPVSAKEAKPAADALWMFMFRFVLASGLLQHEENRQAARSESFASSSSSAEEENKGKRKKPTDDGSDDDKSSSWANFLIEARLHDPRLTLHIAEFAGPKWVTENPYETAIIRKTEALREWEKHVAAMKEVKQGLEDLKKNPGEPLQRLETLLDKHRLPSAMREVEDHIKTIVRAFGRNRPRFNIWKYATETRELNCDSRWIPLWDHGLRIRRKAASDALLHVDPWRDVREPAFVEGTCVANRTFLVERFWLWDAKFRFEDELRALNQARASKEVKEHGFARPKKTKPPASVVYSSDSLVVVSDTETETEDNA